MTLEVTEAVFEQYQEIQRAGPCNMANKACVQRAANDRELYELVAFIEDGNYYEDLVMRYGEHAEAFGNG